MPVTMQKDAYTNLTNIILILGGCLIMLNALRSR
jgi:hypothetical protein